MRTGRRWICGNSTSPCSPPSYGQPITRDGLRDIFRREISRDLIGRLHARSLIATGPRAPTRGAPNTYITTDSFLAAFGMASLRDLPDREQLEDAGLRRDPRDET